MPMNASFESGNGTQKSPPLEIEKVNRRRHGPQATAKRSDQSSSSDTQSLRSVVFARECKSRQCTGGLNTHCTPP
jgi:hypothetical protein